MAHNTRLRASWPNVTLVTQTEIRAIDANLTAALNGDGGGTWAPTSLLTIGGAGVWLSHVAHQVTSAAGGNATVQSVNATGARIVHGDNDFIVLGPGHTGSTRTITTHLGQSRSTGGWAIPYSDYATPSIAVGASLVCPLRVHHGATFVSATIYFKVYASHGPPGVLPSFRIVAVDVHGVKTPLQANAFGGYMPFSPAPATAAAWYAAGAVQNFIYTCSAGTIVDTSKYTYWVEITEESGTFAAPGNTYIDVTCAFSGIPDLRFQ